MRLLNRRPNTTPRDILIDPWVFKIVDSMAEFASMSVWMNGSVQEITQPTGFTALYQLTNFWNRLFVRVEDDGELDASWQAALNHSTDLQE